MRTPSQSPQYDPYADLFDDSDGLADGHAVDVCPRCGPVRLTTREGRLEVIRADGVGPCTCSPAERAAAETARNATIRWGLLALTAGPR